MRFKLKMFVGWWQCMSAIPKVFGATLPRALQRYSGLLSLLELPSEIGLDVFSSACLGSYRSQLLLVSLLPVASFFLYAAMQVASDLLNERAKERRRSSYLDTVQQGLIQGTLPVILAATFVLVPSTATLIFETFLCDHFEYDPANQEERRCESSGLDCLALAFECLLDTCPPPDNPSPPCVADLHEDLSLRCGIDEYRSTSSTAIVLLLVWPVGVPLFYTVLLWKSRRALSSHIPTPLSRATAFLSGDYKSEIYWWEPLEMCRKLGLTVPPPGVESRSLHFLAAVRSACSPGGGRAGFCSSKRKNEQARVLVALLVSIAFLALHLSVRPFQR